MQMQMQIQMQTKDRDPNADLYSDAADAGSFAALSR